MLVTEKITNWEYSAQFLGDGPASLPMETCVDKRILIRWRILVNKQGESFTATGYQIDSFITKFKKSEKVEGILNEVVEFFEKYFDVRYPKAFRDALLVLKKESIRNYEVDDYDTKEHKVQNLNEPFFTPSKKKKKPVKLAKEPEIITVKCGRVDPSKLKLTGYSTILILEKVGISNYAHYVNEDWLLIEYEEYKIFIQFGYHVQSDWANGEDFDDFNSIVFSTLDGDSELYSDLIDVIYYYNLGYNEEILERAINTKCILTNELKNLPSNGQTINLYSRYRLQMFTDSDIPEERCNSRDSDSTESDSDDSEESNSYKVSYKKKSKKDSSDDESVKPRKIVQESDSDSD